MKQIFILTVLLSASISSFASITYRETQNNWRWRNNDGTEATASWKAGQNTAITYNSINEVVRVRIETVNSSTITGLGACSIPEATTCGYSISIIDSLQYSTTPADTASWNTIGLDASKPFVLAGVSNYVVQGQATTSQITGSNYLFYPGKIMVSDSVIKNTFINSGDRSEYEWTIIGTVRTVPNTTYYFRQRGRYTNSNSTRSFTQYVTDYPSLTTRAILPIKLISFIADTEGKKVKVEWSTASEENNDYFNIQSSTDGLTWETINKVNSKGNSIAITNYSVYDNSPPQTGTIYYRLQQYDKDGKYTFSDVRSVTIFSTNKAVVSVLPNPSTSDINFRLDNMTVRNVQAILTDVNGNIIYKQAFDNVQANNLNRLNLNYQLPAGIYILKLKGESLSESIKVIIK